MSGPCTVNDMTANLCYRTEWEESVNGSNTCNGRGDTFANNVNGVYGFVWLIIDMRQFSVESRSIRLIFNINFGEVVCVELDNLFTDVYAFAPVLKSSLMCTVNRRFNCVRLRN